MTIIEIAKHLDNIVLGNWYNREKMYKGWNRIYMEHLFAEPSTKKIYMECALPDGWWYITINRYSDKRDGFDYYIPETREQEQKIKDEIWSR